ncbi:MAG TPA: hypothetical protein VG291_00270 [Xanthobacteraceae bacterium]|jgi:hypothetical protein|nr:hypothetical protein [Xanthobacteraceae bacterium]
MPDLDKNDPPDDASTKTRDQQLLLIWERAIQTQMHFAELSIKTRQVGLTVVGATLGLAIVLARTASGFVLTFGAQEFPISSILCWTAAIVLYAIKLLDIGVYHQMLRGAVTFNEELEAKRLLPLFGTEKGLTQAISFYSRHPDASHDGKRYFRTREGRLHYAGNRITGFYLLMIFALIVAGIALKFAGVK